MVSHLLNFGYVISFELELYPMVDAIEHIEFCCSSRAPWVLDMYLQATNLTPMDPVIHHPFPSRAL